jgi:hypothetical protein
MKKDIYTKSTGATAELELQEYRKKLQEEYE